MIYGQQFCAGLGASTVLAGMDFETYSEAGYTWDPDRQRWVSTQPNKPGLKSVGAWVYSAHPSARVLTFAYDLHDGAGPRLWYPGQPNPVELFEHLERGGLVEAVNSFFEFSIWRNVCERRYGWPELPLEQLRDVAAKAASWTLPRKLETVAAVLETAAQKDKEGARVMNRVSVPRSPTKKDARLRFTREEEPELFGKLDAYCIQDVAAEDAVSIRCADLSAEETRIFLVDQTINARGVHCDRAAVDASLAIIDQAETRYQEELNRITLGAVKTPNELKNMKEFLAGFGVDAPSITKDTLPELLKQPMPAVARRVLDIRKAMGSLSVKKTAAMGYRMDGGDRIRGLYTYAGGRTWRWAGAGVQPQNMPNAGPKVVKCDRCGAVHWAGLWFCPGCFGHKSTPTGWGIEAAEACLPAVMSGDLETLEAFWGDALTAISGCLRSFFTAGPGMDLICSDYAAIEAVVIAELAGETWRQEVFRTHGKIYEMSAAKISGLPFEEFARHKAETGSHHPLRKKLGKVAELASGYQGWINAWLHFGAGDYMSEEEIKQNILAWRKASPAIVAFWAGLEAAAIAAVERPGAPFSYQAITYEARADVLYCHLPSGRAMPYHAPRLREEVRYRKTKKALSYMGVDSKTKQWVRMDTHGGKLTENVVQAVSRDIFAAAMVRLEDAGYRLVLHTHDEPTAEVPKGFGSIEEFEAIMMENPAWCRDWPIKAAGGWRGHRYRKD